MTRDSGVAAIAEHGRKTIYTDTNNGYTRRIPLVVYQRFHFSIPQEQTRMFTKKDPLDITARQAAASHFQIQTTKNGSLVWKKE